MLVFFKMAASMRFKSGAHHCPRVIGFCGLVCPFVQGTTRLEPGGQSEESACISCTPGYFCNNTGLLEPSGPCSAGHYCTGGTIDAFPMVSRDTTSLK